MVFVHGVYVGGSLWEGVADAARGGPLRRADLAARRPPRPGARRPISRPGPTARRIPAFLEALDLHDVTLVGNDTGGGLCLASLGTDHPGLDRIGRLVLTNCDSYEHFPPKGFDRIAVLSRSAPPVVRLMLRFFAIEAGPAACS